MKLVSWNVNGLRACIQKGFLDFFREADADFFCLQETKLQEGQITLDLPGYTQYWCYAEKKGYSGTAIFAKHKPISVSYGLDVPELDTEGRLITLEYPEFFLVTCYSPNSQRELARIDHRLRWEEALRRYLTELDQKKPVILCGDLNVAHQEIDLKNPKANRESAGFSDREREAFGQLLDCGFTDIFRHRNPTAEGQYTWWSYMYNARLNNAGWRIDYFVVSDRLREAVYKTPIYTSVLGSDHCPVGLELDLACHGSIWQASPAGNPSVVVQTKSTKSPTAKKALQGGLSVGILLLGLVGGYFLRGPVSASPPDTDPTLSTTLSGEDLDSGIAPDYVSMSTQELVDRVLEISELYSYDKFDKLDTENYTRIRGKHPTLVELERRTDAMALLSWFAQENQEAQDYNTKMKVRAANNLVSYYTEIGHDFSAAPPVIDPVVPDITVNYTTMSTQELVNIAVTIPELAAYGAPTTSAIMTEAAYKALAEKNPVLYELERRSDLLMYLARAAAVDTGRPPSQTQQKIIYAANCLMSYYSSMGYFDIVVTPDIDIDIGIDIDTNWEDDRRIYHQELSYTIYEYTRAPSYGYSKVTMPGDTAPMQTMTFEGEPLALAKAPEWIRDSNFWVRIETQDTYLYQSPELKINADSPERYEDEMLLHITPYYDTYGTRRGLMIFGFAQRQYHLRLEYPNSTTLAFTVNPPPPQNVTTLELLEYAINNSNLMAYITNGQDVCTYLPLRLLLERVDFFSTMLNVIYEGRALRKSDLGDISFSCSVLMVNYYLRDKIPQDIHNAYQMITTQEYFNYRDLSNPSIVLSSQSDIQATDYIIEAIPESLAHVPMEEWNFCTRVELKHGAEKLPVDQWHLEIPPTWEYLGEIGFIPYYTLASGEEIQGWLITGKLDKAAPVVEFRLYHGETELQSVGAVFVTYPKEIIYG